MPFAESTFAGRIHRAIPCIKVLEHHDVIEAAVPHLSRAVSAVF